MRHPRIIIAGLSLTAVTAAAGGATTVSVNGPPARSAPAASPGAPDGLVDSVLGTEDFPGTKLANLADLHEQGLLTGETYQAARETVLRSII
jgi:hypothetical protein